MSKAGTQFLFSQIWRTSDGDERMMRVREQRELSCERGTTLAQTSYDAFQQPRQSASVVRNLIARSRLLRQRWQHPFEKGQRMAQDILGISRLCATRFICAQ